MSEGFPPAGRASTVRTGGDRPIRFRALPLRLVVAGRFGLATGQLHRLDADGAGGLLDRSAPSLSVRVSDRLRADGTDLTVHLRFRHRRDFAPGAVAQAVPDLAKVVAAHAGVRRGQGIADLQAGLAEFAALREALDEGGPAPTRPDLPAQPRPSATPKPAPGDDSVDRLLDMVDTPSPEASTERDEVARTAVSGFIAEVTRNTVRRQRGGSPPETLEAALAEQIGAVLSHPDFVALERAWASLRFLARRIDMRSGIVVDVVEADSESLADALEALVPEDDLDGAGPVRLVVDLNDYDASDRDVARLRRLAAFGASRRAVVLSNAAPGFCGDDGPQALARMHDPETHFETDRYAAWRTLRDAPEATWLGLCLSRIALRDAVDGKDDKVLRFARPRRIGHVLDGGAAPAVAALVAEAAAATGWACAVGAGTAPAVEDLVLVHDAADGFDGTVVPAVTASAADSLASAGLIVLVPERGRDTARLLHFPTVRRPARPQDRADETATTRLFQAQVVHGLQWNADRIFGSTDPAALRELVEAYLVALLSGTGPSAGAEVRVARDDADETVLAIHVRSGSAAAPGASMAFDIPLGPQATASDGEP